MASLGDSYNPINATRILQESFSQHVCSLEIPHLALFQVLNLYLQKTSPGFFYSLMPCTNVNPSAILTLGLMAHKHNSLLTKANLAALRTDVTGPFQPPNNHSKNKITCIII